MTTDRRSQQPAARCEAAAARGLGLDDVGHRRVFDLVRQRARFGRAPQPIRMRLPRRN